MSESEARMLGVAIDESSASVADAAGGTAKIRTAVVDELNIGDTRLRNVAFLVLPDSQEPMSDWQSGHRGIIGLPIVIALQSITWKSDGTFEIGPGSERSSNGDQNLAFDGPNLVTRAQFEGKELDWILDTGDGAGSQLWVRFANDFATLVKQRGTKSRQRVTQVGGSNEREITVLPEIQMQVGGLGVVLRPAQIFARPVGDDFHDGLLGTDLLTQAHKVVSDFRHMTLELSH